MGLVQEPAKVVGPCRDVHPPTPGKVLPHGPDAGILDVDELLPMGLFYTEKVGVAMDIS